MMCWKMEEAETPPGKMKKIVRMKITDSDIIEMLCARGLVVPESAVVYSTLADHEHEITEGAPLEVSWIEFV